MVIACLGPLGTIPGGQRSQMLLTLYRRGLGLENLLDLTVKERLDYRSVANCKSG